MMAPMSGASFDPKSARFESADEVLFRELGDESVLLHLESGKYFGLDEVGTLLWKRLTEGSSVLEVGQEILSAYEVEQDRLWPDLEALIEDLCGQGLLRRYDGGSRPRGS